MMVLMMLMILSAMVEKLERTLLHSAARELKMSTASGRPVYCMHPQRIWRRGVVTPPRATLEV